MKDDNKVIDAKDRFQNPKAWTVEAMLEDTLERLRAGDPELVRYKKALILLIDEENDEYSYLGYRAAHMGIYDCILATDLFHTLFKQDIGVG